MNLEFLRMRNEWVTGAWPLCRRVLLEHFPEFLGNEESSLSNILEACMHDRMQCWCVVERLEEKNYNIMAMLFTAFSHDDISRVKHLIVYTACKVRPFPREFWNEVSSKLKKFAVAHKCKNIIAYSTNEAAVKLMLLLGGRVDAMLLAMEVD